MKKLINNKTKEETICNKVTIDGFDYYVSDNYGRIGDFITNGKEIEQITYRDMVTGDYSIKPNGRTPMCQHRPIMTWNTIIATNNHSINIPKIIDEVEKLSILDANSIWCDDSYLENEERELQGHIIGFKEGYNKSQETHPNSDEDLKSFATHFYTRRIQGFMETIDQSLKVWKEQQIKTIYYGND